MQAKDANEGSRRKHQANRVRGRETSGKIAPMDSKLVQ
jgi:hypothetical protein